MEGGPHEPIVAQPAETFPEIISPIIQRAMQRGWELVEEGEDGAEFVKRRRKFKDRQAIVSAIRELDGRAWVHLSVSVITSGFGGATALALPNWDTITAVRDDFLGPEAKCIMVVAPKSEHVNLAEVHHLWYCPEGDGIPDFTRGSGTI